MRADKRYFDKAMGSLAVLLSLVPTVVLSVMWNSIPQLIPAHWSADSIDRWGQKWELLIVPTICLISGLMLAVYAFKRDSDDMNGANNTDGANSHFIVRNRRLAIAFFDNRPVLVLCPVPCAYLPVIAGRRTHNTPILRDDSLLHHRRLSFYSIGSCFSDRFRERVF